MTLNEFYMGIQSASEKAIKKFEAEMHTPGLTYQLSMAKPSPESRYRTRVTFLFPGTKHVRPVILFSCIVGMRAASQIKATANGFFGQIKVGWLRLKEV